MIHNLVLVLLLHFIGQGWTTDTALSGQCKTGQVYNEMTLKGGINAGTYKDVGGVSTMEECQKKCCEFSACDLAFMLAGSCYLVGCKDQKQCVMQTAKESSFKPMISYVTRWSSEGVKHSVSSNAKEDRFTCPKMKAINKVTLKGGLQAGDFADIGRVGTLDECYNTCCQQEKCDLAFMLGQNCFTVICKDKKLCVTTPAQPSIFNPQIAYVTKRTMGGQKADDTPPAQSQSTTIEAKSTPAPPHTCPNTKILDNMTLKGGVDAGAYKDHGKIENMVLCRRICCEMPSCHLAFMLGQTCFSVKCTNVDSCRAQPAKPSTYSPKISYVRKVSTNEFLVDAPPQIIMTTTTTTTTPPTIATTATAPPVIVTITTTSSTTTAQQQQTVVQQVVATNEIKQDQAPKAALAALESIAAAGTPNLLPPVTPFSTTPTTQTSTTAQLTTTAAPVAIDLLSALQKADVKSNTPCSLGKMRYNVTLKGGRKSGEFVEQKDVSTMQQCSEKCCNDPDKKCSLAFMLGKACYSVRCDNVDLCQTVSAPPTKFNPVVQYVRGLDDSVKSQDQPETTTTTTLPPPPSTTTTTSPTIEIKPVCRTQPVVRGKSIKGGKKAGKFKIFRAIKTLDNCIAKCCSLKDQCDVAYMEDGNCYSIQCFKKSACVAITLRDTDVNPMFAYMDHFLDKVDEEESGAEVDITTELDQSDVKTCKNTEVIHGKTLKGGMKAGKFHPLGKKSMNSCISSCCDRPNCDIAYLMNDRCFSVQCLDSKLCQLSSNQAEKGKTVQLAYMNRPESADKKRDFMVVYVIVGMVVVLSVIGGLIWAVFVVKRRKKIDHAKQPLLTPEDEEETIDNIMHKKPSRLKRQPYRQPRF